MMKIALYGLLGAALAACGGVTVDNDNPTGAVGGILLDAASEAPLPAATVKVTTTSGVQTAMTGMDGTFVVQRVPAGIFIVEITATGYVTARFTDKLAGAVGNFPVRNTTANLGVLGLIKNTGVFNVRVVDEKGGPTPMVKVMARPQVRFVDFSSGSPVGRGSLEIPGTSDANGLVVFAGIPDYASVVGLVSDLIYVDVAPTRVMGTEAYQFLGLSTSFRANNPSDQSPTITLAGPHTPLLVVQTNLPFLMRGTSLQQVPTIPATGPVELEFNQAVDPKTVRAQFLTEDGVTPAPIQPTVQVLTNIVELTPQSALTAAARYNVLIHAQSLNAGAQFSPQYDATTPFFVAQTAGVKPAIVQSSLSRTVDGSGNIVVTFSFNEPVGLGSGAGSFIPISCVAFYEANLSNGSTVTASGEWKMGAPVVCPPPPPFDVTAIRPVLEPGGVTTGFSQRWQVIVNTPLTYGMLGGNSGACVYNLPAGSCVGPQTGTKVHLVFSRLMPGFTLRRLTGEPLVEDPALTFTSP